jgi:hypothetical protein
MSEQELTKAILDALNAGVTGVWVWRNNVGVLMDENGRPVRFGLANDSPAVNKVLKSSDLVGPTPMVIQPWMVGMTIGVFTAIETKETGWRFSQKDERAVAQRNFHDIVKRAGGRAGFATCEKDYFDIIGFRPL